MNSRKGIHQSTALPLFFACLSFIAFAPSLSIASEPELSTPGQVTMIDLGAHTCTPCKLMEPILTKLKKDYQGKATIAFIDVRENRDEGYKYDIRAIPTQIFYDIEGKEVYRHEVFLAEASILNRLGVAAPVED
ncbi:MAG: thioredoxin family protein [Ghiorsea sp.]